MNKIFVSDNYIIVDIDGVIKPFPMNHSEYNEDRDHFIIRKFPNKEVHEIAFTEVGNYFDEAGTTAYTEETLRTFLRQNTGFSSASGGVRISYGIKLE